MQQRLQGYRATGLQGTFWPATAVVVSCVTVACSSDPPTPTQRHDATGSSATQVGLESSTTEGEVHFTFTNDGSGAVSIVNSGRRGILGASDSERIAASKPDATEGPPPAHNWKDRLREQLSNLSGQEHVDLFIVLPDTPFPWSWLRPNTLSQVERADLIAARRLSVGSVLEPVVERLAPIALDTPSTHWIVPAIRAVVPLDHVEQILTWSEPREIVLNGPYEEQPAADNYSGLETRAGLRASDFLDYGYTGDSGGQSSGRVRVGVYDSSVLASGHPGFKRRLWLYWSSRFQAIWNCEHSTCSSYSPVQGSSHGSSVTSIAVGSIEAGQDANITDADERVEHSGISSGANIYYYTSVNSSGYVDTNVSIVERATSDGIDVFNRSGYWNICTDCDPGCMGGGYTTAVRNSTDAGVLHVAAIGNFGDPGGCTATYPATIRHGLAIGALASADDTDPYDDLPMASVSGRGGMDIYSDGGWRTQALAIADLVAPGCIRHMYTYSGGVYGYSGNGGCYTSWATPVVTGSVALLKEALYQTGHAINDADVLLTQLLLTGDSWESDHDAKMSLGMDQRSGAGRVHLWYPSSNDLTAPWGWGCHKFQITNDETRTFTVGDANPESQYITQWKAALTFNEPDLTDAADVDLEVWDTCPQGGGEVRVTADVSTDIRSRVRLLGYQIGGRCLEYRVYGWHVPQGESRWVSVCDYYHSGDPDDH